MLSARIVLKDDTVLGYLHTQHDDCVGDLLKRFRLFPENLLGHIGVVWVGPVRIQVFHKLIKVRSLPYQFTQGLSERLDFYDANEAVIRMGEESAGKIRGGHAVALGTFHEATLFFRGHPDVNAFGSGLHLTDIS